MECTYTYNINDESAITFDSYDKIIDFLSQNSDLLKKHPELITKYDVVFNNTPRDNTLNNIIKLKQKSSSSTTISDDNGLDLEPYDYSGKGYIGITAFLNGLKNKYNELLFPKFEDDQYWTRRRSSWERGMNTPDRLSGFEKEEINFLFEKGVDGNPIIDEALLNDPKEMQRRIKEKWKAQSKIGTNIHNVFDIFFSYDKVNGTLIKDLPDDVVINYIESKNIDLNRNTIENIIKRCRAIQAQFPDANFFSELTITSDTQIVKDNNPLRLRGRIDLLVLDRDGNIHIIDFKTAVVDYIDFDSAKALTFNYQMAVYSKLLRNKGFRNIRTYISPIKLHNLHKENNKFVIDDISSEGLQELFSDTNENIQSNIEEFLPTVYTEDMTADKMLSTVSEFTTTHLYQYDTQQEINREKIQKEVEESAKFNPDTNKWIYKEIVRDTKEGLVDYFYNINKSSPVDRAKLTERFRNSLSRSIESIKETKDEEGNVIKSKNPEPFDFPSQASNADWLNNIMSKYISPSWTVLEGNDIFDHLGIILLKNTTTRQIDVIVISNKDVTREISLDKGNYITGNLQSDIKEQSDTNSLILDSTVGNMELMRTMCALNQLPGLLNGYSIGEMSVMNPRQGKSTFTSNETLKYNWMKLNKLKKAVEVDLISSKLMNHWEIAKNAFRDIMLFHGNNNRLEQFKSSLSKFEEEDVNPSMRRALLIDLKNKLETAYPTLKQKDTIASMNDDGYPYIRLYALVTFAIAETDNIKFPQIYKNAKPYLNDTHIFSKGISGLQIDNPGNLIDKTLNMLTSLVMQVYQNVRETIQRKLPELNKQVDKLKESKGKTSKVGEFFTAQASLYSNMIEFRDGNIFLKNPWKNDSYGSEMMTNEEVEFLKYFLIEINKNRYPNKVNDLENVIHNSNDSFFYLPLAKGDVNSIRSRKGLLGAVKENFKQYLPKNIINTVREQMGDVFIGEDDTIDNRKVQYLFEMRTRFDRGESKSRLADITANGLDYYEYNLETLLLEHLHAYTTKEYMDEIFPDIQAIMLNIQYSQFTGGGDTKLEGQIQYVEDFIRSKIFRQTLDPERFDKIKAYGKIAMKWASYLALAFNPKQLYQGIEGIWKDVLLWVKYHDTDVHFTFSNLKDSFLSTLPEMIPGKTQRSKWQALNELYALNDMGIDEYVNRIKSDRYSIFTSFERWAFKFASRPDFYNRATIFGAQLRGDGSWEAHEWNEETGTLTYDWKKDKRFEAFANNRTSDPEYNKQKMLYLKIAKQMELEHTRDANGNLFKMYDLNGNLNDIPKAYTTQMSESYKDMSDSIYGYYSEEKKALVQSHMLGAMIFQMNTYWSAKKNQYFAPGGVRLQGRYVEVEGYYVDENGEPTTENTGIPLLQWQGDFQEGIIITAVHAVTGVWSGMHNEGLSFNEAYDAMLEKYYNDDDGNMRRAFNANMRQLFYDMFMFMIMGQLIAGGIQQNAKEYIKNNNNPFANLTVDYASMIFKQSFVDYNAFNSIFGRGTSWTPFAFNTVGRIWDSTSELLAGDRSFSSYLKTNIGAFRTIRGFTDTVERNNE